MEAGYLALTHTLIHLSGSTIPVSGKHTNVFSLSLSIPLTTVLGSFELYSGRGAWIPTLPNEAMWLGLSQWFGIQERDDLSYVLPNMNNFGCRLYSETDIYRDGMGKFMLYHILFVLALLTHFGIIPISGKLWGCGGDVM